MSLDGLRKKSPAIPPVNDYYGGVAHTDLAVPDYILVFARPTARLLGTHRNAFDHHHRFVLIVNLATSGSVGVDGQRVRLQEGQALLVFPHQFHHYLNLESDTLNWLFITFELPDPSALASLKNLRLDLTDRALNLLSNLVDCTLEKGFEQHGVHNALALWLALLLDELQKIGRRTPRKRQLREPRQTHAEVFIERVHDYLLNHIGENFKLKELAQSLQMSESHLRSSFRRHFGVSIGHYIRESRIAKACGLIHNSDLNFSQVADACGFDSVYSFSRAFKRAIGVPPRDYRRFVRETPEQRAENHVFRSPGSPAPPDPE